MIKQTLISVALAMLVGACADEPKQAMTAPPPPPPPPPTFMVFFDMGSSTLSQQSQGTLQQAASAYKPGASVAATGYTDTVGTAEYNMILSQRRADAAKAALVKGGVPATAIATAGKGEGDQLVKTGDGVAEPQNRRVQVVVNLPAMAMAPPTHAYCKALADKVRTIDRGATPQGEIGRALAQCDGPGPYDQPVMVLETQLNDAKVPLPARS
ncbi:MAG: OmpA family protein [Acidimicrobiia bacterium]